MLVISGVEELKQNLAGVRQSGKSIAFVPTMGALHDGHLSLVEIAREQADFVVVSIFVNPLQFSAGEDFDRYPRTLQADAEKLAAAGVDLVFAPSAEDVYPHGDKITESAGPIGKVFEGAVRPGHFDGMLTVVARLFDLVRPDFAVFGQKDAQQLFLIHRMVNHADGRWGALHVIAAPIIREASGLAMSSRNRFLDEDQLAAAEKISTALRAAEEVSGPASVRIATATEQLGKVPAAKLDYVALVDPDNFESIDDNFVGRALLLVAVKLGDTRLIDNQSITI